MHIYLAIVAITQSAVAATRIENELGVEFNGKENERKLLLLSMTRETKQTNFLSNSNMALIYTRGFSKNRYTLYKRVAYTVYIYI